ncbi:serine/threonine-protein kinase [Polyangium mundeleinium]|uniref:Serine/threonine-protein kinase n=1 Tax=Polyangium mundeleinium TaxID=2995306 RepID=A0ABT5F000_9BACT|nr:serine/threonine-protein kinase [Polyangium mundeleinium]MDC0747409.1 serine/threonine-protein kinase [Polyangium mundeleinium]
MAAVVTPGETLLGKYRVERVLGQGGMGIVVAARHEGLGELFAIKLMLAPNGASRGPAVERFLREARNAARLKSEHVAKVHDVGRLDDGRPYMVMEYLEGRDLADVIERRGPLPVTEAAGLVLQACDALVEAHALGIVHRDLKPSNMFLIRRPNGKPCLKLLDFGIAKRVDAESKALTATGALLGSPLYMSPEQLENASTVGPRSDVWAMGVVFYQLTTGRVPFEGEWIGQVVHAIMAIEPKLPSKIRPELPVEVDAIVDQCLRKNPEERYATMGEFASAVRELLRVNSMLSPLSNLLGEEAYRALSAELASAPTAPAFEQGPTQDGPREAPPRAQAVTLSEPPEKLAEPRSTNETSSTPAPSGPSPAPMEAAPARVPEGAASTQSPVSRTMSEATPPPERRASPPWIAIAVGCSLLLGVCIFVFREKPAPTAPSVPGSEPEVATTVATPPASSPPAPPPEPSPAPPVSAAPSAVSAQPSATATAPRATAMTSAKTPPAKAAPSAPAASTTKSTAPPRDGLF